MSDWKPIGDFNVVLHTTGSGYALGVGGPEMKAVSTKESSEAGGGGGKGEWEPVATKAEIERLKALVKSAYKEGWMDGSFNGRDWDNTVEEDWVKSDTKAALGEKP